MLALLPFGLGCAGAIPVGAQPGATPAVAPATAPSARPGAPRPRLVVLLTVDQLRPDYLDRWRGRFTGGLRRLLDEGAFFPRGVHDHGITETAPGHAAVGSGRFPYSTGIASNNDGVNTPDAPLVGASGAGASPFRFIGTALADWMLAADPATRVLSVSRKDRGAILPVGRGRHPVFWYAQSEGRFVTSTYYADSLPGWVGRFNAEDPVMRRYAGREWTTLLDASSYPEPDSVASESGGQSFTFPHLLPADELRARNLIIGQPVMDELTLELAWRGVREMDLGGDDVTDLLAVSLSTVDAVGHRFGPDSRETHDAVLRLDRYLGVFLDSLVALRGADRVVVALTSDHGVAPAPEVRSTWGDNRGAIRVTRDDFEQALGNVAPRVLRSGIPPEAFAFDGWTLEVDRSKAAGKEAALRDIARAFAVEARKVRGVLRADALHELARADTVADDVGRRWLHQFRPGGAVLTVVTLRPYNTWGWSNTATHGSPHDYDARVPILFWGAPFGAGRDEGGARVVDIAPTLAALLGVSPLEKLDGVPLRNILPPPMP